VRGQLRNIKWLLIIQYSFITIFNYIVMATCWTTELNTWNAYVIQNMNLIIGSRHNMHSESRENMVKCYVIYENCYHHHNIFNVKNQFWMHIAAPEWSHFIYMRIIHNTYNAFHVFNSVCCTELRLQAATVA